MTYEIVIENTKPLIFKDKTSLLTWCQKEAGAWGWTANNQANNNIGDYAHPLRQLTSRLSEAISVSDQSHLLNEVTNHLSSLNARIAKGSYIYSRSPLGEFILSEKEDDEAFAGNILYLATRPENTDVPNAQVYYSALTVLSNFKRGISKRGANASIKAIGKAHAELEALVHEEENQSEGRIEKLDALIASREQKIEASTKTMASTLGKHKSNTRKEQHDLRQQTKDTTDEFIANLNNDVDSIRDNFETQMALQAPIEYWKAKGKSHKWATGILALVFIAYSSFALYILISYILGYPEGLSGFIKSWKDAGVGAVASFAGLIGLGMVIARILYRLFASQLHLWNDSHERVTMIQTYLSLAQKGHAKEEFLGALLQRLFSPSSDGIVKSDLGSVGIADAVAKIVGGR